MKQVYLFLFAQQRNDLLEIHLTDLNCEVTKANDGKKDLMELVQSIGIDNDAATFKKIDQ